MGGGDHVKVAVKVTANAKKDEVVEQDGVYLVKVREAAKEGKANDAVIRQLAHYLRVPRSSLKIKSGFTSRRKVIEVADG